MERSQQLGAIIIAATVLNFLFFLVGVLRRSYFALAYPTTIAVGAASALALWVGWTMMNADSEVADLESGAEPPPA